MIEDKLLTSRQLRRHGKDFPELAPVRNAEHALAVLKSGEDLQEFNALLEPGQCI